MYIQLQNFGASRTLKSLYPDSKYECVERIHQFPEIVCILEGSIEITVDGKTELAREGDLCVITPFRTHSFRTPTYAKIWIGVFSLDFAAEFLSGENIYTCAESAVFTPTESLFNYVSEHLPKSYPLPENIADEREFRSTKALVYAVFEEYTRLVPAKKLKVKGNTLADVLLYLSAHYAEDVSLISLSEALGYTPTYISHCISVIPNMNFRKLLNSMRVDKARELIPRSNLRMADIALECGFSGERSFNRAFLEICGCTPSEYKREKINKHIAQKILPDFGKSGFSFCEIASFVYKKF